MGRMKAKAWAISSGLLALAACSASPAWAQAVLPKPPAPFAGTIGKTYADSVAAFPAPVKAPKGAPNIMLILTDDTGFGASSTFGGPVPTPNLDRLAARGLVYNRFHVTAMCSPTRAALLTGRNHHAVGNGVVADLATGFPGYDNILPKSAATIAEVLRDNGYSTAMFGKHHNTPYAEISSAGPFDRWPTRLGFDYFYGFMGAETNQFTPALYRGTTAIPTLKEGVLDKALADEAIGWLHNQKAAAPDKPFFVYYATGSTHAPLQAPADWIARFKGKFDAGWDAVRADTVARQKKAGIIPANTVNTARPDGIQAWSSLTPDQRRVNARMMEIYAAMLAYQDAQIGRVLDELERMGELDNTLILFIEGDNGAAAEGGSDGGTNPMAVFANGMKEDVASMVADLDKMGGPDTVLNYAYGWAWAMNAPFKWFKQQTHLGGTRDGLVVSWPKTIQQRGLRTQFTHAIDVMPTILEAAGIEAPAIVNGTKQQPLDGISFAYTFAAPKAPERHGTQYFEMMGNHALYQNGWVAVTTPVHLPWKKADYSILPTQYKWELYNLNEDFSQAHDLAARYPERLKEMQALFVTEGKRNNVFPLDDRMTLPRFQAAESQAPARSHYVYWGSGISVPALFGAPLLGRGFTLTAQVDIPAGPPPTGALVALGSKFGGWSFYLKDGRPVALMAASQLSRDQLRVATADAIAPGKAEITYAFKYDGGFNGGGEMVLLVNKREVARGLIPRTISKLPEMTDTLDIGFDADTPVTSDYPAGGHFPGTISKVEITVGTRGAAGGAQ